MFSWLGAYDQFVGGSLLVNVLLVMSLFVVFQCGVLSLATVGFMADGAYTASLLSTKAHWSIPACILVGALAAGLIALIFGRLVLHLRGIYLALGTFALGQVCVLVISNIAFTGGNEGIAGIPTSVGLTSIFWVVVVVCIGLQVLHRSRPGRALRAMRLDDRVASGVGVNVSRYQAWAFALSGTLAGLAGGLEAFRTSIISPDQYNFTLLIQVLALAMIGGSFHWSGGVLAALVIGSVQQVIGEASNTVDGFLYGGLLVAVMLVLPEGIVDRRLLRRLTRLRHGRGTPRGATPTAGRTLVRS